MIYISLKYVWYSYVILYMKEIGRKKVYSAKKNERKKK